MADLAYLTSFYPAVSHTFIRREIAELERRGHRVLRLSVRPPREKLVDPADLAEVQATRVLLAGGVLGLVRPAFAVAAISPRAFLRGLWRAMAMGRRSHRGVLRHLAYFLEGCAVARIATASGIGRVHAHFGTHAATVALLAKSVGGPGFSFTIHGPEEWDEPTAWSLAEKVEHADAVIAISSFCGAQVRRWTPPEQWKKLHVVRCGIEEADLEAPTPIASTCRTLVCVGRLAPQKGHVILLDALSQLRARNIRPQVVLAGDGELRGVLEEHIRQERLDDQVEIAGWVSNERVRALLRSCRAMVLPSFAEGLPVAILEAFAATRPVISTYVAGIPELVEHGVNGWLVPSGDARALADCIEAAWNASEAELEAMGRRGQERVRSQHGLANEVAKLEEILRALPHSPV